MVGLTVARRQQAGGCASQSHRSDRFVTHQFPRVPLLALLHRRGELELGQDVLSKNQDDFTHRFLESGASRDLIQT